MPALRTNAGIVAQQPFGPIQMLPLRLAVLVALSSGLAAQVPYDHVVVLEARSAAPGIAFRFVDPLPGGGVTELRSQSVFAQWLALDPGPTAGGIALSDGAAWQLR